MTTITLGTLTETEIFGRLLAGRVRRGDVFLLTGELGAGKTSLCRSFLREFTGDEEMDVPSPSYLITIQYSSKTDEQWLAYHVDPYRLSEGSVSCLVDFEKAAEKDVLLIEWPSRLGETLSSLIEEKASRVMRISIGGVGPQAEGRQVTLSVRSTPEEQSWLSKLCQDFESTLNNSERRSKILRLDLTARPHAQPTGLTTLPHSSTSTHWTSGLVMGIESSCDDTAVAIVRETGEVVAECIASQGAVHAEWGGVVPKIAQEEHAKAITSTVDACLAKAGIAASSLSAISVTVGPGLALCLQVGVRKAIELSAQFNVPLIRIHHMEAHMMITRLPGVCQEIPQFPFVTLLVSGGHTMIVLTRDLGDHVILGSTIDDSVGEAFDKTARLLGITAVPGGRELEKLASTGDAAAWTPVLPKPLSRTKDDTLRKGCDMSYAGLKTSVRMAIDAAEKEERDNGVPFSRPNLAAAFQQRCADHLAERLKRALQVVLGEDGGQAPLVPSGSLKHVVVAGGVAANTTVKEAITKVVNSYGLTVCAPPPSLCTDNGVMVAWTGIERLRRGLAEPAPKIKDLADVDKYTEVRPRWPLGVRHTSCHGRINDTAGRPLDRKANDIAKTRSDPNV
jgi:N6-L-threonylcarbamoyladenine synthase